MAHMSCLEPMLTFCSLANESYITQQLAKGLIPLRYTFERELSMLSECAFCSSVKPNIQPVRLLVSARAYQPANSVFLSQQTSTSRAYQPRNQPANKLLNLNGLFFFIQVGEDLVVENCSLPTFSCILVNGSIPLFSLFM